MRSLRPRARWARNAALLLIVLLAESIVLASRYLCTVDTVKRPRDDEVQGVWKCERSPEREGTSKGPVRGYAVCKGQCRAVLGNTCSYRSAKPMQDEDEGRLGGCGHANEGREDEHWRGAVSHTPNPSFMDFTFHSKDLKKTPHESSALVICPRFRLFFPPL